MCSGSRSATSKTSESPTGRRNAAYTAARNAKPRAAWSKGKSSRTRSKPSNNSHSSTPNTQTDSSTPRDATRLHTQLDKLQFNANEQGQAIKICSINDEHTREPIGGLVEHSITADRLTDPPEEPVPQPGAPTVLR